MKKIVLLLLLLILNSQFIKSQNVYPKRELRGAWIAVVGNIDWPTSSGGDASAQKKELREQVKKLYDAGINVVFFQVRTECDALYQSSIEPWSYWLTGQQGREPVPFFDPLQVVIEETHFYGMELHAWFNPFRVLRNKDLYKPDKNHISITHPEWILTFGKYKMLNPGIPEVRDYVTSVVADVTRRYNIDGVHFDDYFYPSSPKISYQDASEFRKFGNGINNIDDWRRNNINNLIAQVHDTINLIKPYVKFGVSPFGIVENHYAGTSGFESYNVLYCDPLTWIKDKTIDYIMPQLYWEIGKKNADYTSLIKWWSTTVHERHLYIGHFASKFFGPEWKDKEEIGRQIRLNRSNPAVKGSSFFSSRTITHPPYNFADVLKRDLFKYKALLPQMQWKDSIPPLSPVNLVTKKSTAGIELFWSRPPAASDSDRPVKYVVYRFNSPDYVNIDNPANIVSITENVCYFIDPTISQVTGQIIYIVTSLDRFQNESTPAIVTVSTQ